MVRDLDELYASRLARDGRPAAAAGYARQAAGFVLRVGTTRAAEAIGGIESYRTDAALVGLYGVLANAVTARRREIGIRSALGAAPGRLLARVLLSGAVPVTAGILAGTAGAAAVGRLLAQHLFGLAPLHPGAYATAVAVVLAITVAACAFPAYRASKVSPASVLREE